MHCSSLRAHLCFHLHVIDNPACICVESETTVHDIIFGNDTLSTEENKLNMDVIFQFVRETARFSTVPFVVR